MAPYGLIEELVILEGGLTKRGTRDLVGMVKFSYILIIVFIGVYMQEVVKL